MSGRELWEGKWRRGKRVCEGKEKAREVEGEKRGRRKEYEDERVSDVVMSVIINMPNYSVYH